MGFTLIDHLSTPFVYFTQSLWRDEAFSYVLSKHSIFEIVRLTSQDFNPPLYYLLLHFWMDIFGNSEVAMRSLSFIFYILTVFTIYKFAGRVFNNKVALISILIALFNPMLLYFSFEARMYSLLAFVSVGSMYCYFTKNWKWWFMISLLGIYTHLFFWFNIAVQMIVSLKNNDCRKNLTKYLVLFLMFIPWAPFVLTQMIKGSQGFWVNRIDMQLIVSSIGNIFTSYEGTPGGLWRITGVISFVLVAITIYLLKSEKDKIISLLTVWLYFPLSAIILISLWKPLFVNRYLIFLVIPMIFFISKTVEKCRSFWWFVFGILLIFEISTFFWLGPYYRKADIRDAVRRISMQMVNGDVIVSKTPLTYFEVNYYSGFSSYLYATNKNLIPTYVGKALIDEGKIVPNFNSFKHDVFLVNDDGSVSIIRHPFN